MKIIERMKRSITKKKGTVVLTRDFLDFGSKPSVAAALKELVAQRVLCRLGYGVYGKLHYLPELDRYGLKRPFEGMVEEAFDRLGVEFSIGQARQDYLEGKTNQVPMGVSFLVHGRFARTLALGGLKVVYERNKPKRKKHDRGICL